MSSTGSPIVPDLHRLYAEHAPPDGLGAHSIAEAEAALRRAADEALVLARLRPPGCPALQVRHTDGDRPSTVVEIVTDDLPYLVESVLAGVSRVGGRVRRVIHPVVRVHRTIVGELTDVLTGSAGQRDGGDPAALSETWIHLELDPFPVDEEEDLHTELRTVINEVRDVAHDRDRMLATAVRVSTELGEAGELLRWLTEGHFTFLGYRRYHVIPENGETRVAAELGSGLGVLRGDSLRSRPPASPTDPGGGPD